MSQLLLLVDEEDNVIGYDEKLPVHQKGLLHRAFSIVIFNSKGEMLIQKRAKGKYHSGGLWTNTCCSHPLKDEVLEDTLQRKLKEEMGFTCPLTYKYKFIYKYNFDNGLTEYELDYVYTGMFNGEVMPNPEEAEGFRWVKAADVVSEAKLYPEKYTEWFKHILARISEIS
ncbi:isopentenyl-diphosphate Delta-isomerase [Solitalea lacus]|uniref:isopentenyl-diphosphate Delta-isomerase n=1 Tax=Solitalea lacus TaxID=2911172 RepID=UPI001EDAB95B|nr:isopentenyl-diphosphate Delta-isomerase [Solitalea lacus]UKJ08278.1 isopentenyl-diphosphate Delta-isomerase [Solitalea lacus]